MEPNDGGRLRPTIGHGPQVMGQDDEDDCSFVNGVLGTMSFAYLVRFIFDAPSEMSCALGNCMTTILNWC